MLVTSIIAALVNLSAPAHKAVVIGVDGLRADSIQESSMPFVFSIAKQGGALEATNAWTEQEPWNGHSATNWGVLLTGLSPATTDLTHNDDKDHLVGPGEGRFPTIYEIVKSYNSGWKTGLFNTWGGIGLGDGTILSNSHENIDLAFHPTGGSPASERDLQTASKAAQFIKNTSAEFTFIHFSQCDAVGHSYNYDSPEYMDATTNVDDLIREIWQAIESRQTFQDEKWLILITSDHGGQDGTRGHADNNDPMIRNIPLVVNQPRLARQQASLYDVAPTVLAWLADRWLIRKMDGDSVLMDPPVSVQLLPIDEGRNNKQFTTFRESLMAAIAAENLDWILNRVAPEIHFSFGSGPGKEAFIKNWKQIGWDKFLTELQRVVENGGHFQQPDFFSAPYTFSNWPAQLDAFSYIMAVKHNTRVFAEPNLDSEPIGYLNYEAVGVEEWNSEDFENGDVWENWFKVRWRGAYPVAWVHHSEARHGVDYRAGFKKINGSYMITYFIAGD